MNSAAVYGRAGSTPRVLETKTGTKMVTVSIAVNVADNRAESDDIEWIKLLAFGRCAELLEKHEKGDSIGAMGRLERHRWTGQSGEERSTWQLVVDALHSSRTVRPGSRKRSANRDPAPSGPNGGGDELPFDDAVPF